MKSTQLLAPVAASFGVLLTGCLGQGATTHSSPTPTPTAPPSGTLHIELIGAGGPYSAGPPELVAARSEPELDALLHAVAVAFQQPDLWDNSGSVGDRVYLGIAVRFCTTLKSITAQLTGPSLVTLHVNAPGQCAPGAGAAARPPMYLAAIRTAALPPAVVTFRIAGTGGQARVDLRPAAATMNPSDVTVQARDAVQAALFHVGTDGSSRAIGELDVVPLPNSPPLCNFSFPAMSRRAGILVVVNEGQVYPLHEEAFVWLDGALADCGTAP